MNKERASRVSKCTSRVRYPSTKNEVAQSYKQKEKSGSFSTIESAVVGGTRGSGEAGLGQTGSTAQKAGRPGELIRRCAWDAPSLCSARVPANPAGPIDGSLLQCHQTSRNRQAASLGLFPALEHESPRPRNSGGPGSTLHDRDAKATRRPRHGQRVPREEGKRHDAGSVPNCSEGVN